MPYGTHDFIGDHQIQFAPLDTGWYEWLRTD